MISDRLPRAALVTGAARRIGGAIARALARDGFAVAIHYHSSGADAEALAAEIRAAGGNAAALEADLSREASVAELVPHAVAAVGPLGLLVNNASCFERDEVLTATRATWDAHLETNLRAPFVLIQAFAQQLADDAEGVVVNMIDERVWNLTPHFTTYTLSKAGLWTLTQTLAIALAPRIRVNGIGPGPTVRSPRQTEQQFARQVATVPLRRGPAVEEICDAVRFLLRAQSMTGQMLALDGGQHLSWSPQVALQQVEE
jgi:NAD(P)-dependent dehydrogenase (short-subunit alcohol dehydrogenase family)